MPETSPLISELSAAGDGVSQLPNSEEVLNRTALAKCRRTSAKSASWRLTDEPDRLLLRVDLVHLALVHLSLALEVASQEASRLEDGPRSERADSDGGKERGEEEVVAGRDDDLVSRNSRFRQRSSALQHGPSCRI